MEDYSELFPRDKSFLSEKIQLLTECIEFAMFTFPLPNIHTAEQLEELGDAYVAAGKRTNAIQPYKDARGIFFIVAGPDAPSTKSVEKKLSRSM